MSHFDLREFEARLHELLIAHDRLKADYDNLEKAHAREARRNREIREQLAQLIERIRALEAEAGNV